MINILKNKKILLGVTGSIAAYKSPLLVRECIKQGADVKVIMTPSAKHFVSPMLLSNLSRNAIAIDMFDENIQSGGAWHIHLAHWCDLMIIAPCTATTIGKLANGICDNSLVSVAIALPRNIPLIISPAMDTSMLEHPSTIRNLETIINDGTIIIPPDEGELSSGLVGPGRMPDINIIMNYIAEALKKNSDLNHSTFENENYSQKNIYKIEDAISKPSLSIQDNIDKIKWAADYELSILKNNAEQNTKYLLGKNILVTAGPTIEQIDDVRYISNFSSGKMGYAIAEAAFNAGANVILISGPTNLNCQSGIKIINVQSADEMFSAVINNFFNTDIAILAAAVSDYKPAVKHKGKIKKNNAPKKLAIELVQTKDILLELGNQKRTNQILVGFALESDDEIQNGIKKHKEKKCDLIVINSLNQAQKVFGSDNNTITLISKDGSRRDYPTLTKRECATLILRTISDMLNDINN